jgi:hypothetical protein
MSKQNDFSSIGQVYGSMLNNMKHKLVSEGKIGTMVKPGEIGEAPLIKGGPQETAGYMPPKIDRQKMSDKELEDNLYNIKNLSQPDNLEEDEEDSEPKKGMFTKVKKAAKKAGYSKKASEKIAGAAKAKKKGTYKSEEDEETIKESRKIAKDSINNFMRSKSIFDKLYENVMGQPGGGNPMGSEMGSEMDDANELDALGIEGESEGMEETGEEVTFTLDRDTAQKLIDVLQAAIGGEEEGGFGDEDGDMNLEDGDMEEDKPEEAEENFWDEDEEDLGANNLSKEVNYGKNNKVGNLKTQSGGASSAYTDKVGADGDHGHALVNAKQPNMGKNNKVGSLKTGKSAFEQ